MKWNWLNNKITLDTVTDLTIDADKSTSFKDLAVNTTNVPYVPAILQELGIFPISGDDTLGNTYHHFSGNATDERFPRRGGFYHTSNAGLGCVSSDGTRGTSSVYFGVRSAYLE